MLKMCNFWIYFVNLGVLIRKSGCEIVFKASKAEIWLIFTSHYPYSDVDQIESLTALRLRIP